MSYFHPIEKEQHNLHYAMDYNSKGQPVVRVMTSGFVGVNNQSAQTISLPDGDFVYQFERNGLTGERICYTLAATGAADGDDCLGSIDWEEIF